VTERRSTYGTRTLAIAGRKGGTGKTTSAVNLAGWLARHDQTVLLVDLDPQGNATLALGVETDGRDVWRLLVRQDDLVQLVREARPRLDILAGGEKTASARDVLAVGAMRDARAAMFALRDALKPARYDYILIDCPPSLDLLAINGLMASQAIALPVPCQFLGVEGARQFIELAAEVSDAGGRAELRWIIPTFYRAGVRMSESVLVSLQDAFAGKVTDPIRLSTRVDEATKAGQTIFEYDPRSGLADDYQAVAEGIHRGW
jgi:chromosome partitioning protein